MLKALRRFATNKISGKPFYVGIEPLWRCNADCDFCGYRKTNGAHLRVEELTSYEPILSFLNPIVVTFAGGETLLRPDLEQLVEEAKHRAEVPIVQVTTNGSRLTRERYQRLSEAGLDRLNISLDFADERHSESRGLSRLYDTILDFLEDIGGRVGAVVGLNVIYMRENLENIRAIMKLAKHYGIKTSLLPYTTIRTNVHEHALDQERVRASDLLRELRTTYSGALVNSPLFLDRVERYIQGHFADPCDAGRSFLWVLPDGRLTACNINPDTPRVSSDTAPESLRAGLDKVRRFKEGNSCQACYLPCRGETELAASNNPITLTQMAFHFSKQIN